MYYSFRSQIVPNWQAFVLIVVILIHLGALGMGFGIIVSSLTTKYRDLSVLVGFGIQLWMYATPIVYPLSQINDGMIKKIMLLNPVTAPVEAFRYVVLGSGSIDPYYLIVSWIVTIVVLLLGIMIFNKVERTFMDTV